MYFRFTLFTALLVQLTAATLKSPIVQISDKDNTLVIENGYVRVTLDKLTEAISDLSADFSGASEFKTNVLARPFSLTTVFANSTRTSSCAASHLGDSSSSSSLSRDGARFSIVSQSDDMAEVFVEGVRDCADSPVATENWHITLHRSERFVKLRIEGGVVTPGEAVVSIGHGIYSKASSLFGLFDRGVVQMMNNIGKCLGSDQPVNRLYALGNDQSIDVLYRDYPAAAASSSSATAAGSSRESGDHLTAPAEVVLLSQYGGATTASNTMFGSGFQDVLVGSYPRKSLDMSSAWSGKCWDDAEPTPAPSGLTWAYTMSLGPNNMDFPVYPVPFADPSSTTSYSSNSNLVPDMPELDVRTFLTGVYANPVGCLQSYYDLRDGTIAPTISHPDVGYSPNTNFFDPDNYISVSAMMYSGDSYLMNEVRKVLERTAETMCGIGQEADSSYCDVGISTSTSTRLHPRLSSSLAVTHPSYKGGVKPRTGQLMHHFINLVPTYESIATSEQLGPNVFWTLSAIRYASLNNDQDWLLKMLPFFELSARYLTSFYDEDQGLLLVPGPLWIDVIVRENYTSDSNAIAPHIFRQLAEVFESLNTLSEFSTELHRLADKITVSMNSLLWDLASNDHYITQLNADLKTTRDFIDYDSNLLAVAFGVAPDARLGRLLDRVDSGAYTHIRGTWCCELPYSGDAEDCYIVGGDVCGDSIVTLGRIGWADSHARKRVGDLQTFNSLLLEPLQRDLVDDTWLFERYDANGTQIRTSYYFEYPSLVTMMLTEIRYGIDVTLSEVKVDPFPVTDFTFSFGSLTVHYSQEHISLSLEAQGATKVTKKVSFHGLTAGSTYLLQPNACTLEAESFVTCAGGVLSFDYQIQSDCPIVLKKIL